MQLEYTIYQIITNEPTFEHQVKNDRKRTVAEDFRTFTMPHVTHVSLSNREERLASATLRAHSIKRVAGPLTNRAKLYRHGGIRLARLIFDAFRETDLNDFVFWLRARACCGVSDSCSLER